MTFNPTFDTEPEIKSTEELSYSMCWLIWFDVIHVQSMHQMFIYPRFRLLAKWLCLLKMVFWLNWMETIVLFRVLAMLVVQSSCFAICVPPLHFPLQLPAYETSSLLDQGYKSDQASRGLKCLRREYLQMVVRQIHCLWGDELVDWAHRWQYRCTDWS